MGWSDSTLWTSYCLHWVGFNEELEQQSPDTLRNLRLILAILPLIVIGLAAALLLFYTLSEKRIREVREILEERRLQRQAGGSDTE